jgi:predicted ester cyclase
MATQQVPNTSTSTKAALDRNITPLNARDMEGYLANQQSDVVFVLPGGVTLQGRAAIWQFIEALWTAFPDGSLAFGEQVYGEDAAAVEVVFTGTHTGPLMTPNGPSPPTGRQVSLHQASILRIKDGLIASEHGYADPLEMLAQLGLTPAAPGANDHSA